ncbi:hypothetical protein HNQ77_002276 [Silvibacterium bohemicum]|uniref:Uncharacterized protein n=1 Tax=Silvibacterium bohemicum TaxID=1577686 RepID=A0A841K251_9BACT|nr:hypothetical protein [Silvibacterium bohemicum]MBB6144324.1 hypothetical protein [Silvibacterium bohemicum]
MSSTPVPFGHGYAEIPLGRSKGKPIKSIHVYQLEEALNIDLEFEDKSMIEMIFRIGVSASVKLLENKDGDYHVRQNIKPKLRPTRRE